MVNPRKRSGTSGQAGRLRSARMRSTQIPNDTNSTDEERKNVDSETMSEMVGEEQDKLNSEDSPKASEDEHESHQHLHKRRRQATEPDIDAGRKLQMKLDEIQKDFSKYKVKYDDSHIQNQVLKDTCKDTQKRYQYVIEKCLRPYAQQVLDTDYDYGEEKQVKSVVRSWMKDLSDAKSLREQFHSLQQEMLANVKEIQAVPGPEFKAHFGVLVSCIQTLSRNTPASGNVDVFELLSSPSMDELLPRSLVDQCKKKYLTEVYIWSALIDTVFNHPFLALGKPSKGLHRIWCDLFEPEESSNWPCPTPASEDWRHVTMKRAVELTGEDVVLSPGSPNAKPRADETTDEKWKDGVAEARAQVINKIHSDLKQVSPHVDVKEIHSIVNQAFKLALNMSLQRARIQISYPKAGAKFVPGEMTCLPSDEGQNAGDGMIAFVLQPGLTKWGNAFGKFLNIRLDIFPSLVQLQIHGEGKPVNSPLEASLVSEKPEVSESATEMREQQQQQRDE